MIDEDFARQIVSCTLEWLAVPFGRLRQTLLAPILRGMDRHMIQRMPVVIIAAVFPTCK
jgi:hypothetical protein